MVNSVSNSASYSISSATSGNSAQDAIKALLKLLQSSSSSSASQTSSSSSATDPLAALFSQIDTSGKGTITKSDLEAAVTKAGGSKQAADALWAKLDPNNTGSIDEQQFAQNLPKPGRPPGGGAESSGSINITINITTGNNQDQNGGGLNIFA